MAKKKRKRRRKAALAGAGLAVAGLTVLGVRKFRRRQKDKVLTHGLNLKTLADFAPPTVMQRILAKTAPKKKNVSKRVARARSLAIIDRARRAAKRL